MANMQGRIDFIGDLEITVLRGDGRREDLGIVSSASEFRLIGRPLQWWRALWQTLKRIGVIPAGMGFALFLSTYGVVDNMAGIYALLSDKRVTDVIFEPVALGLVVTGGANFLATDFASGQASPRISSMNFHDSGTGTTAATSTDSGLQTQAGPATRATGTQTNPATNQYKSVGTIAYTGTLAITEWGLFNQAAQGGTLWDRRVFSAINVVNGDSVTFSYTLTCNGGGT